MNTQAPLFNRKTIIGILLTSIITVFLSSYSIFFLSLVPLIFTYYKKGIKMYGFVVLVSIILFVIWEYSTVYKELSSVSNEANIESEIGEGGMLESASINTIELFFYTILQFLTMIIGCSVFLIASNYSWMKRIAMIGIVSMVGMFLQLKMIDAMFVVLQDVLKLYTTENNIDGEVVDMLYKHRRALFTIVGVITAVWSFVLNFMITTLIMCRGKGIDFSLYCQYVFHKTLDEYKRISVLFAIVMIAGVTLLDTIASLELLYLLCVGGLTLVMIVYIITGVAYGYYLLHTYVMKIRGSWYFFSNSVIIILPIVNMFLLVLYFLIGIYFDIKKTRNNVH